MSCPIQKNRNPIQKIEKTVKIRVNLPHMNKKPLPRNRIFVQTPFSHSTLKLERKKITPQNHSLFLLHFLFRRDRNHYSNLTSKIMKMCEQILKKKTAPQYNSNSLNCKNQEKANNSPSCRCAAIKNEHILLLSIRDREETTSRTRQRFFLLNSKKKERKQNSNIRNIEKFCKKNGQTF